MAAVRQEERPAMGRLASTGIWRRYGTGVPPVAATRLIPYAPPPTPNRITPSRFHVAPRRSGMLQIVSGRAGANLDALELALGKEADGTPVRRPEWLLRAVSAADRLASARV